MARDVNARQLTSSSHAARGRRAGPSTSLDDILLALAACPCRRDHQEAIEVELRRLAALEVSRGA